MNFNKSKLLYFLMITTITLLVSLSSISAADSGMEDSATSNSGIADEQVLKDNTSSIKKVEVEKETKEYKTKQVKKEYTVGNYDELYNTIEDIKANSANTEETINLNPGNYTITNTIKWGNTTQTTKLIINANNQTVQAIKKNITVWDKVLNDVNYEPFIFNTEGYTVVLNNIRLIDAGAERLNQSAIINNGNMSIINSTLNNNTVEHGGAIYNTGNLNITNSTLNNNIAHQGGVIYSASGNLIINNSNISDNNANYTGGAIYNNNSAVCIISSNFNNNSASIHGGAIYNQNSIISITDSRFNKNNANDTAGAIYSVKDNLTITNSDITANNAGRLGGALYNHNGTMNITDSNITDNNVNGTGEATGGAIGIYYGVIIIANSNITDNNARETGGVIHSYRGDLIITNSNITNNNAVVGGAIDNEYGNSTIINSNITGNNASSYGGALFNYCGDMNITNSNITDNNAKEGGAIDNEYGNLIINNSNITGNNADGVIGVIFSMASNLTINNSNISDNTARECGAIYNYLGDIIITNSNITGNNANGTAGAILIEEGNLTINNSSISNNTANQGGAIFNINGSVSITGSDFNNNHANDGGVIYNDGGDINITNSTLNYNNAENSRVIYNKGNTTIDNSTIYNEFMDGIYEIVSEGYLNITNTNITTSGRYVMILTENEFVSPILYVNLPDDTKVVFTFDNNTMDATRYPDNHISANYTYTTPAEKQILITYPAVFDNTKITIKHLVKNEITIPTNITTDVFDPDLEINMKDVLGNNLTGTIPVKITVKNITQQTNITEGKLQITLPTPLKAGDLEIKLEIPETSEYGQKNGTIPVKVIKQTIKPITDTINITYPENVTLNYTFEDIDGNPIKGTNKAAIKIDGKTQKTLNITGGKLETDLDTSKIKSGKHNITIVIGENTNYEKLETNITLNMEKQTIKPITDTINTTYPGNVTLNYTFEDADGNPITGTNEAAIKIDGKTQKTLNITGGKLETDLDTGKLKAGKHTITIVMGENRNYKKYESNITLNVAKQTIKPITGTTNTTYPEKNLTINYTFTDADGKTIEDVNKAAIKINGKTYKKLNITNGKLLINLDTSMLSVGKHTITIILGENSNYQKSESNITLNIARQTIKPITDTINTTYPENVTLNYTFTDVEGKTIQGINKVAIKINGKTYKKLNITNGKLEIKIDTGKLKAGKHTVTIILGENTNYKKMETNMTLNIAKQTIKPITDTINTTYSGNVTLNYTFEDADGNPITGTNKVAIKIDGKTYKKLNITNGKLETNLDTGKLKSGTHTITIVIGENSNYTKCENKMTLTVV